MHHDTRDVLIARSPILSRLLERCPELGREHHWEGQLVIFRGRRSDFNTITLKASIAFHGSLIEGAGSIFGTPTGSSPTFTICGTRDFDHVAFQIWRDARELRDVPYETVGQLACDGREMTGEWSRACLKPGSCGCEGWGGRFRLQRVD